MNVPGAVALGTPRTGPPWSARNIILLFTALGLLLYTVLRAVHVSFSWDESWTFVHHVRPGMFYQEAYDKMGGNHHLLNVWGMWVCMKLFGTGEFALRLPNLLAHVCYLYASARIVNKAPTTWLAITSFLLLNAHPYLLDFFSLARGYGLSYGFMMLSLWQMLHYVTEGPRRSLILTMVFAALSALAHVIMVNYLLGLQAALILWWLVQQRSAGLRTRAGDLLWSLGITTAGLLVMLPNALGLFQGGSLNVGCETLWHGTVRTLGEKFLYHQDYSLPPLEIMGRVLGSILLWVLISGVILWRARDPLASRPLLFSILVFACIFLSMALQRILFGVFWPQSRTALFLMVLLFLILSTTFIHWRGRTWLPSVAAGLFCVPLIHHMVICWNMSYAVEWKPSGELRKMLEIIKDDHLPLTRERPFVSITSSHESWGCLTYYRLAHDMHWLIPRGRDMPAPYAAADYYIVEFDGFDQVDPLNWTLLYYSSPTGTALYRDERLREPRLDVLYQVKNDVEHGTIRGYTEEFHHSGKRSIRIDTLGIGSGDMSWVVPVELPSRSVIVVGSLMVRQTDDDHWMSLTVRVDRNDSTIGYWDTASAGQLPTFDQWCRVGIAWRIEPNLIPGDRITFVAWPTWPGAVSSAMFVDDMELQVMRDPAGQ